MVLKVCGNTRFRQSSGAVRRQAVRPASVAVRPAIGWRSDRRYICCEFEAGPKIEGVGKRGDSTTLGLIVFGASRQKFYWFENSSRFRFPELEIWLSPWLGGQTGLW